MSVLSKAKQLNKEFQNNNLATIANIVPEYERLSTGCMGLDWPLYGGLPLGRVILFSGQYHSGKTSGAFASLAAYQRKFPDKTSVFVDVEHAADLRFQAIMNKLDLSKLLYVSPSESMSGEQIWQLIIELQEEDDIGMIVVDSIPAMISGRILETADIEKDFGMAGHMARKNQEALNRLAPMVAAKNNILLLINQVRISGRTHNGAAIFTEPGGSSLGFVPSVKVRFGSRKFTKGDKVDIADSAADGADGFRLSFAITKNKTAPIRRGGGFITYRYETGVDYAFDAVEVGLSNGFIARPTSMTYLLTNLDTGEALTDKDGNELKFIGKQKLLTFLRENKEFTDEYISSLIKHISNVDNSNNILDKELLDEIKAQEESVEE